MVLLIWLFVWDELSYNQFLPGYQDVYLCNRPMPNQASGRFRGQLPRTETEWLRGEAFPEIAAITRDAKQCVGLRHGEITAVERIERVDADFLAVLGYPWRAAIQRRPWSSPTRLK
jgi:hypothetical protein